MWKSRYNNSYKTSDPNLIITSVCSFPNLIDTIEKAVEYYNVKEFQKDKTLLDIISEFWFHNGNDFIPLYFADDIPKLNKLQELKPINKGFFWCICYQNPYFNPVKHSYSSPSHKQYREWLEYWMDNYHKEHSSITSHLFKQCVYTWIYENSKDFSESMKSRRFDMIANKRLEVQSGSYDTMLSTKEQMINYIEEMYNTNLFEFIFKAFK